MKTKILTVAVLSSLLAFPGAAFAWGNNGGDHHHSNPTQTQLQGQGQGQLQVSLQGQGQGQGQSQHQSSSSKNFNGNGNLNGNFNANYNSSNSSSSAMAIAVAMTPPQIAKANAESNVFQKGVVIGNSVNSAELGGASSGYWGYHDHGTPPSKLVQISSTGANSLANTGLSGINAVAQTSGSNNSVNNSASGTFSISMVNSGISGALNTH